ncbi:MAG: glutamyl-tRNA reductase, partial [Myxococcales bacterium]
LSHREVPISVREQVAVSSEELPERLRRLKSIPGVQEAFLVSTCNRLEIFSIAESRTVADDLLREIGPAGAPHAVVRSDDDALAHLFRVAASLDSMVVGEAQILGQMKEAHELARRHGAAGACLGRLMARAQSAAKRVRTETQIARGAVSVASVAVQLARKVLGDLSGRTVLLIGAGEMAQLAARELHQNSASDMLVANRSTARAEEIAREVSGVAVNLAELPNLLERADVVLCSTGAREPVVTHEMMVRALKARRYRPAFLIDLAVPRNVEPSVNELENVYVYDMDDLERVASENRELREQELARAEAIVREELAALRKAERERTAVPVLARLREHAQGVAKMEAERTLAQLAALDDKQKKAVQAMAQAIVNKLLHGPTSRLREEQGGPLAEAAAELFGLNQAPEERALPATGVGRRPEHTEEEAVLPPSSVAEARRPQHSISDAADTQPADVLPISGRK